MVTPTDRLRIVCPYCVELLGDRFSEEISNPKSSTLFDRDTDTAGRFPDMLMDKIDLKG